MAFMAVPLAFMIHREMTTSVPKEVFRRRTVHRQLEYAVEAFGTYVQNITNDNLAAGQAGLNDLAYLVLSELGKDWLAEDFRQARDELIERSQETPRLRERPTRAQFEARKQEEEEEARKRAEEEAKKRTEEEETKKRAEKEAKKPDEDEPEPPPTPKRRPKRP